MEGRGLSRDSARLLIRCLERLHSQMCHNTAITDLVKFVYLVVETGDKIKYKIKGKKSKTFSCQGNHAEAISVASHVFR